jgi:predicted site-specific integrase-resolvase
MKRVLILARVSTGQQETQNQLLQLRQYCEDKNYAVVKEVSENISGEMKKEPALTLPLNWQARPGMTFFYSGTLTAFPALGF